MVTRRTQIPRFARDDYSEFAGNPDRMRAN